MTEQDQTFQTKMTEDESPIAKMAQAIACDPESLCFEGMSVFDLMQAMANAQGVILVKSSLSR